jgi:hypothetical protein
METSEEIHFTSTRFQLELRREIGILINDWPDKEADRSKRIFAERASASYFSFVRGTGFRIGRTINTIDKDLDDSKGKVVKQSRKGRSEYIVHVLGGSFGVRSDLKD